MRWLLKANNTYVHKTHKTIDNEEAIVNGCRALAVAIPLELNTEGGGKNIQVLVFSGSIYALKAIA